MLKPSYELNSCGTIYHPTETQWVKNVNLSSSDSAVFLLLFFFLVWSGFGQDMLHWPDIILVSCWAVDCCSCSLGTAAKKKLPPMSTVCSSVQFRNLCFHCSDQLLKMCFCCECVCACI